ncbi:MAG: hypothetical protein AAGD92_12795 [Pseudomonadota bacterium]
MLRRSNPRPLTREDEARLIEQLRANIAFEHIAVSVLVGAGVAGALSFVANIALDAGLGGSVSILLATAFVRALITMFLVFLIGFFAGVAVMTPLFRAMEKAKRRSIPPYVAAAFAIALVALFLAGAFPGGSAPGPAGWVASLAGAGAMVFVFAQRIRSLWAAADRAETQDQSSPQALH